MSENPDIQTLLEKNDGELLALLYEHADERRKQTMVDISRPGVSYWRPPTAPLTNVPWANDEKGSFLLRRVWYQIVRRICLEWRYYEKHLDQDFQDRVQLVAALSDVLASVAIGIPPTIAATLVVKRGLKDICHVEKQFSSLEEYLGSLLSYPSSPLFHDAIAKLANLHLSSATCEIIFARAGSEDIAQYDAAWLYSFLIKHPDYKQKALPALLDILISSCKKKHLRNRVADKIEQTLTELTEAGSLSASDLLPVVYDLASEWQDNKLATLILCKVLGRTCDKKALDVVEFCFQKRRDELKSQGRDIDRTNDRWFALISEVRMRCGPANGGST